MDSVPPGSPRAEVQAMRRRIGRAKGSQRRRIPLDPEGREALELVARAFARCGFAPSDTAHTFKQLCDELPGTLGRHGTGSSDQSDDAAHVLTLWFTEPEYLMEGD